MSIICACLPVFPSLFKGSKKQGFKENAARYHLQNWNHGHTDIESSSKEGFPLSVESKFNPEAHFMPRLGAVHVRKEFAVR